MPGGSAASPTVGRITGMVDCQWEKKGTDPICRNGPEGTQHKWGLSPFSPKTKDQRPKTIVSLGDTFALSSGLMEITYDTGAKVILQGPVTYEVESRDGGFLSLGKLTARVENTKQQPAISKFPSFQISKLFVVRTPTATVTDLGTEFGVEVDKDGTTTSHVFAGMVRLTATAAHGGDTDNRVLSVDQTARVIRGSPLIVVTPVAETGAKQFVRDIHRYAASQVISINFTHGGKWPLDPTERTGVLRAAHWNNVDASSNPAAAVKLCNGAGEPTRAEVSWQWAGPVDQPSYSCTDQPIDSREKLLSGFFCGANADQHYTPLTISVGNIPYASYRVYLYYWMDPFPNPDVHTFTVAINGGPAITIGRPRYWLNDFYRYQSVSESGNYQVFDRLSGDLTVTALPRGDARYHTLFIAGVQIVGFGPAAERETRTAERGP